MPSDTFPWLRGSHEQKGAQGRGGRCPRALRCGSGAQDGGRRGGLGSEGLTADEATSLTFLFFFFC